MFVGPRSNTNESEVRIEKAVDKAIRLLSENTRIETIQALQKAGGATLYTAAELERACESIVQHGHRHPFKEMSNDRPEVWLDVLRFSNSQERVIDSDLELLKSYMGMIGTHVTPETSDDEIDEALSRLCPQEVI